MRIITGLLKGRSIPVASGLDVRPTTDRVKEGLFSVMDSRRFIQGCTVLDLFAGTGNLGFEALSRGAKNVLFVDENRKHVKQIEKTAREFEVTAQVRTAAIDVIRFLQGPALPYDLIFADPPYVYPAVEEIVELITEGGWLKQNGWLILEHNKYHHFDDHRHYLLEKKYGRTFLSFFQGQPTISTNN